MGCVKYQFATFELERAPRELGPCLRCWAFGPPLLVYWCWFKCCTLRTLMKAFFVPGREQECIDLVSMMLQNIECDNINVFFYFYYYSVNVKPNLILHKSLSEKYSMEDCFCHWIIQKVIATIYLTILTIFLRFVCSYLTILTLTTQQAQEINTTSDKRCILVQNETRVDVSICRQFNVGLTFDFDYTT